MTEQTAETISYPAPGSRPARGALEHTAPHVIVLFGATGDLARRKLLPGLAYLATSSKLAPDIRIVGTSMEDFDDDQFRAFAKAAVTEFSTHPMTPEQWDAFARPWVLPRKA